ncbi:MAG: mevalonate kinase, partial [Candidatus Poseidoniia archaeon]
MEFTAPGKVILFGEHAVVYGHPAIAVPLSGLRARAWVEPTRDGAGLVIHARDLGQRLTLGGDPAHQFSVAAQAVLARAGAPEPNATVNLESAIPSAVGMGSSAATSTAVCRALAAHLGAELSANAVSNIVFQAERVVHGTPSGIDNTVVAHEEPV